MKLTTEKIGNERIEIKVNGFGEFTAIFNDQDYKGKTLAELKDTLTKAVKKASQQGSVEVTVIGLVERDGKRRMYGGDGPFEEGAGFVQAKLRAKHERQHNTYLLVTSDDRFATKKFQVSSYAHDGEICRRLTLAEAQQYLDLMEAERVAKTALEDFIGGVKLNPDEALEGARKGAKS